MLYNTVRYQLCSSFASLRKIFTSLPNSAKEGIHIDILGAEHTRVRSKFSKHLGVRNNSFALWTCCVACDPCCASPGSPKLSITIAKQIISKMSDEANSMLGCILQAV